MKFWGLGQGQGERRQAHGRRSDQRRRQQMQIELPISESDINKLVEAGGISPEQAQGYLELIAFRQRTGNRRNVEDDDIIRPASFDKTS